MSASKQPATPQPEALPTADNATPAPKSTPSEVIPPPRWVRRFDKSGNFYVDFRECKPFVLEGSELPVYYLTPEGHWLQRGGRGVPTGENKPDHWEYGEDFHEIAPIHVAHTIANCSNGRLPDELERYREILVDPVLLGQWMREAFANENRDFLSQNPHMLLALGNNSRTPTEPTPTGKALAATTTEAPPADPLTLDDRAVALLTRWMKEGRPNVSKRSLAKALGCHHSSLADCPTFLDLLELSKSRPGRGYRDATTGNIEATDDD